MLKQCFKCSKVEKPNYLDINSNFYYDNNPNNIPVIKKIVGVIENNNNIISTSFPFCFVCDDCYNILLNENRINEQNGEYYYKQFI